MMNFKNRIPSLILGGAMALSAVSFGSLDVNATTIDSEKEISLGTGNIDEKEFVYFGNYEDVDLKWKVLDAKNANDDSKGIFLLSEYGLDNLEIEFDSKNGKNIWQDSSSQDWCKQFANIAFNTIEKTTLKTVSKEDAPGFLFNFSFNESSLIDEKVFFISAQEAFDKIGLNDKKPGYITTTSDGKVTTPWWFRTSTGEKGSKDYYDFALFVRSDGRVAEGNVKNPVNDWDAWSMAARPAFNLNSDLVLFTSAAEKGKLSGVVGADGLVKNPDKKVTDFKATVKDDERNSFTASTKSNTIFLLGHSDWTVDVIYENAKEGKNEYVSAMLCDELGNVLYYGNIASNNASGTQTLNLPKELGTGNYVLKVFSEQKNGDKKTDLASNFSEIPLAVEREYHIIDGANSVWTQGSGKPLNIAGDGAANNLKTVNVDGKAVGKDHYTIKSGSTNVALTSAYLETLNTGKHSVEIVWKDGRASTSFTIDKAYSIKDGADSIWIKGSKKPLSITGEGTVDLFQTVKIDGQKVDKDNYSIKSGSTIVTFTNAYLESLKTGKHTVEIVWSNGRATTTITVIDNANSPHTGDNGNAALWAILMLISVSTIVAITIFNNKRKADIKR